MSKYLFLNKEIQISNTVHLEVVQTWPKVNVPHLETYVKSFSTRLGFFAYDYHLLNIFLQSYISL